MIFVEEIMNDTFYLFLIACIASGTTWLALYALKNCFQNRIEHLII